MPLLTTIHSMLLVTANPGAQLQMQVSSGHDLPCCKRIQLALYGCVISSTFHFNWYRHCIFGSGYKIATPELLSILQACKSNGRCAVIDHTDIEAISCREVPSGMPPIQDTDCCRFTYCALLCCSLLQRRNAIDCDKAAAYIASCRNFDGGFGARPGLLPCGFCSRLRIYLLTQNRFAWPI